MVNDDSPLALWHLSAEESSLAPAALSSDKAGLNIRAAYSLISTGTERLVAQGQVPPSLHDSMQVPYQEGDFNFPIKYGYSWVGRIEESKHPQDQHWVHLLHPHQDWARVAFTDLALIPKGIPPLRATLASNLETAVNAVWEVPVSIGDRVLVMGFGIIGSLLARLLAAIPGLELEILEQQKARQDLAVEMGFTLATSPIADYDMVFNTTAHAKALQFGLDHLGQEGTLVELSWYGQRSISLLLGAEFHQRRLQIISSQVSQLPAKRRARWDYRRRKALVFQLLQEEVWDQHLREIVPFAELPAFFQKLRAGYQPMLGVAVDYGKYI